MSESKTPITDAVYRKAFHSSWPENLDIMTAHSKKQEAQLSALQAQIEAGELVPADVAVQWSLEIPFGGMTLPAYVKQFTAEKAGKEPQ